MLIMALVSWWYTSGWAKLAKRVERRTMNTLDLFSVSLLAQTLFDPFRQIAAGRVRGPIGLQFRAWLDRLFSRAVGAVVRLLVIFVGLLTAVIIGLVGIVQLLAWPLIPVLPVIALLAGLAGWTL